MTTKTDITQEREAFEAWYVTQTTQDRDWWGWEEEHCQYGAKHSRLSWAAWQARAAVEADRRDHPEGTRGMVPSDEEIANWVYLGQTIVDPDDVLGEAGFVKLIRAALSRYGSSQPAASAEQSTHIDDDAVDHFGVAPVAQEPIAWKWRRHPLTRWECVPFWDSLEAKAAAQMEASGWEVVRLYAAPVAAQDRRAAPNIEAAAETLAECMDYPWKYMPEKGRDEMRKHANRIIDAASAAKERS